MIRWASITEWPGPTALPARTSQFRSTVTDTKKLLVAELTRARAHDAVVALDIRHGDLSKTGELLAQARPTSARVLLTFDKVFAGARRTLVFPCWTYVAWQENLHAIALTLAALRAIARYGATLKEEQYAGFARLGAGEGAAPRAINTQALALAPERAARILVEAHPTMGATAGAGVDVLARALLDRAAGDAMLTLAQEARAAAHPDRGGRDGLFATVNAAFEVLRRYHRSAS